MKIIVEPHTVRVLDRKNLQSLSVNIHVGAAEASERLRHRGIGYVDGDFAYLNARWLQALSDDRRWHEEIREVLSFAECHGWFDGVYLRARLDIGPPARGRRRVSERALH